LIRNSWGAKWRDPARGNSVCACITEANVYKPVCSEFEGKQNVGCWFKKEDLIPNTGVVSAFK
jgi:hypothetical protein